MVGIAVDRGWIEEGFSVHELLLSIYEVKRILELKDWLFRISLGGSRGKQERLAVSAS
jgi:hypothetical protein